MFDHLSLSSLRSAWQPTRSSVAGPGRAETQLVWRLRRLLGAATLKHSRYTSTCPVTCSTGAVLGHLPPFV